MAKKVAEKVMGPPLITAEKVPFMRRLKVLPEMECHCRLGLH